MRILGFVKYWPKLNKNTFTTFRYPRRDKDWQVGEKVQVVIKPRTKDKVWLGVAEIIAKEKRNVSWKRMNGIRNLSFEEAVDDGFKSRTAMISWLYNLYGDRILQEPMHKLILIWKERSDV